MKHLNKLFFSFLLSIVIINPIFAEWVNISGSKNVELDVNPNFELLYGGAGSSLYGDFSATGNSILSSSNPSNASLINDTTTFKQVDASFTNTDIEKRNSSQGTLNLPSYVKGSEVVWAGLFWQGHIYRNSGSYTTAQITADAAGWNSVTFKTPDGVPHTITSPIGVNDTTHKTHHHAETDGSGYRYYYGAYHDVTDLVKNSYSDINDTFTVGNLKTTAGKDTGGYVYINQAPAYSGSFRFGLYGGWSLVVVYNVTAASSIANDVPLRNVSIYDGYDLFLTWGSGRVPFETTIPVSGFITPKEGNVSSKMLFFGGAGDRAISDDTLAIRDRTTTSFNSLNNIPNTAGSQFNHTYTNLGVHMTPGDTNKQGMDLDIYDVSDSMENGQTETVVKFGVVKNGSGTGGNCDQVFPQVIGFSTQLYEPVFCYDYAYRQQNRFFTEDNNGSKDPELVGSVINGQPITMTMYIRNQVASDIGVENMHISVTDINTSQAIYIDGSTRLALGSNEAQNIFPDHTDSSITNVDVGTMSSNDFFYLYYNLDPSKTKMDMPITVTATYDIVVGSSSTPYTSKIGQKFEICSDSGLTYNPTGGLFNVVHNSYYNNSTTFYNLPTQVTQREGNFKIISLDPDVSDGFNTLKPISTIVAVELIDAAAFHDTEASCREKESAISEKVWVMFENNTSSTQFNNIALNQAITDGLTSISSSKKFYEKARENAAFRISYNRTNDGNDALVEIEEGKNPGQYKINFTELVQNIGTCAKDMDGKPNNTDTVAQWCGNNSNKLTKADIAVCMECVYGLNTQFVCSRDNFSIRPEAFLIQLDDQNQTNKTSFIDLTTLLNSGTVGASATPFPLSSGYDYKLDFNATNFSDNKAVQGYTKSFNTLNSEDLAQFIWEPRTSLAANVCNDESNKTISLQVVDGVTNLDVSVEQVGDYRLNITDTTWTNVDSNSQFMLHHVSPYFTSAYDCIKDNSDVQVLNSSTVNGCNISSNNLNPVSKVQYNDYNVTFHPYKYSIANTLTNGPGNNVPLLNKPFVYMANLTTNMPQAVHLNTNITPQGYNNTSLSNYVNGCYARPLNTTIIRSATTTPSLTFSLSSQDFNTTSNLRVIGSDVNASNSGLTLNAPSTFVIPTSYFQKDDNGTTIVRTDMNYNRDINVAVNPEDINYTSYTLDDNTTLVYADLKTDKYAETTLTINQKIFHYYGRVIAPKIKVICNTTPCRSGTHSSSNTAVQELVSFVVYCNQNNPAGTICSNTQNLPNASTQIGDIRWWSNRNHNKATNATFMSAEFDGSIGTLTTPAHTSEISRTVTINEFESELVMQYNGALPYNAYIKMNSSSHLIYSEANASASSNEFLIEFVGAGGWSGKYEDNSTTKTNAASTTNRRVMW